MIVWVDGDACPVKTEIEAVATRHKRPVKIVCNGRLRPSANPLVEIIYVSEGLDVADRFISEHATPGDVVVTADIPLAADCIAAGALVLQPDGSRLYRAQHRAGAGLAQSDDRALAAAPVAGRRWPPLWQGGTLPVPSGAGARTAGNQQLGCAQYRSASVARRIGLPRRLEPHVMIGNRTPDRRNTRHDLSPVTAVIFDIGNVLIEWQPERFYDAVIGEARRNACSQMLICTP